MDWNNHSLEKPKTADSSILLLGDGANAMSN